LLEELFSRAPFVGSGLISALETWQEGFEAAFRSPVACPVPLAALCPGESPEEAVRQASALCGQGYRTFKLKIGAGLMALDIARIRAVGQALPREGELRLDANQALTWDQAMEITGAIADLPIALLEQPFPAADFDSHQRLANLTPIPLMLDESIWTEADVHQAAAGGIKLVKLKLCKHKGLAHTRKLIALAKELGLEVVLGNGVQTVVGNHLEMRIYAAAGLSTAAECNGFLKVANFPLPYDININQAFIRDQGLGSASAILAHMRPHAGFSFAL
jgi:L-Ala-D/L-Glu epimerase